MLRSSLSSDHHHSSVHSSDHRSAPIIITAPIHSSDHRSTAPIIITAPITDPPSSQLRSTASIIITAPIHSSDHRSTAPIIIAASTKRDPRAPISTDLSLFCFSVWVFFFLASISLCWFKHRSVSFLFFRLD